MAMEPVSLPRDNSLEELSVVIEEKKGEVKRKFTEVKKLLEISENTATNRLDRIYTDVREGVERSERTVTQLEKAKDAFNSTLDDNTINLFLQSTNQNIDDQIAKARNSACVVPKHISLRWSIEELKQSIENVCEVIFSLTAETPVSTEQPNKIELEGMRKELEQRTKELVSLQKEKLQMQVNYQNEISNLKFCLEELNYNCSSLRAELQKQSEYSKHTITTESADKEDRITALTTRIRELEDKLTTKDTYISRLYSELENSTVHYSNLEKELQTLKSAKQPRSGNEAYQLYCNTDPQRTPDSILQRTNVEDLDMQLTLKYSECEDLQRKVVSLQSDLREAQDMLAAKLESPREFGESLIQPGFTRKDYSYKTSQTADVDYVRIPKKQIEQYESITQDLESQISQLQKQLESKETETATLKVNLDDSSEVLENTRLQLQQTQQTNSTKVQSKRDSQTGTVVKEKPAQYTQVVSKHKQPKYATIKLSVKGKSSQFYTLNQVDNPSELVGELIVCRARWKSEYVIGTLKVVIAPKYKYEKTIVGIEFTDEFGDSSGSYRGLFYFKTNSKCALFIPTTEVYISYNESPK